MPSYRWKRPWSMTTGRPPSRPSSSRPTWPGAVAGGQPGRSSNGIASGILEVVREPAQAGAEDDADLRARGRSGRGPRRRARAAAPVGRSGGWAATDRAGDRRRGGAADRTCGPPGTRPGGRRPGPAGFVRPTGVSTPGCRSRPVGRPPRTGRGETAAEPRATKRPKRPAAERRSLMRSRFLRSCRPLRARPTLPAALGPGQRAYPRTSATPVAGLSTTL